MSVVGITAGEDLTGKENYFVKLGQDNKAYLCGDGEQVFGVVKTGNVADQNVDVWASGTVEVYAGHDINSMVYVSCDSSGKARTTAANDGSFSAGNVSQTGAKDTKIKISLSKIGILDRSQPVDADGIPLSSTGKKTEDGTQIYAPNQFPSSLNVIYQGDGDDVAGGLFGGGSDFAVSSTIAETVVVDWQWIEETWLIGGYMDWEGADIGDAAEMWIYAPPSPATQNIGAGAYSKTPIGGGINMFVPTAGDWDLDLNAKLNANVNFAAVVPVPAPNADGFFDLDPETLMVSVNATQTGMFNLFDSEMNLARMMRMCLIGGGAKDFRLHSVKARRVYPHWKYRVKITNGAAKSLKIMWSILLARKTAS